MKKDLIAMLKKCNAIKYGEFVLRSGRVSKYYVDIKIAATRPEILSTMAAMIAPVVRGEKIAGMELGAVPILAAVSLCTGKDMVIIRKKKKEHGIKDRVIGEIRAGEEITMVEDVTTTGGSLVECVEVVRACGGVVKSAVVVVDRCEGASEALEKIGVNLIPLLTIDDVISGA